MKHTALLLLIACLTTGAFALNKANTDARTAVTDIRPGTSTKDQVKKILGEPTMLNINNESGRESWQYKADDYLCSLVWDNKAGKLDEYSYSTRKQETRQWDNALASKLITGSTSLNDVINILGDVREMHCTASRQTVRYVYADNNVMLEFKQYTLVRYTVEQKKP